jgi:restriction system protein
MTTKKYIRIMLGKGSCFAELCHNENFIGTDFDIDQDLKNDLFEDWREFNQKFVPIFMFNRPDKSKVAAGLACGALWTVSMGIKKGDIVLCPRGDGNYLVGEVTGDYFYKKNEDLPHRRNVRWYDETLPRSSMSQELKNSSGSIGTTCDITKYSNDIELLLKGKVPPSIITTDPTIEDASVFAMEIHLEDFLIKNWTNTELGKKYDIFEEEGEPIGRQYQTDTGPMDILAISKNKKELLVVELKRGRASDFVVGQIQRYMGFVKDELAEDDQVVKGVIVALEDDLKIKRALSVTNNIDFYRYKISFSLIKS